MSLAEIREILNSTEKEGLNITFKHAMLLKTHFANKLKKLTEWRFLLAYYHSLIIHACQQYCINYGGTANTKKEVAMFTTIKNNTNLITRYQANEKLKVNKINKEVSVITKLYQPIKNYKKTLLSPLPLDWKLL